MALRGGKAHIKRLRALTSETTMREVGAALFAAGEAIEDEIKDSIMRGSAAGQSGGKHQHIRSAPGEAPNNEVGDLIAGVETTHPEPLRVQVISNAAHSKPLEFGTSRMAARPHVRPARDKMKPEAQRLVQEALNRAVRRSRSSD